ncbi:hypothetical protein O0L34_g5774 [Tuta absoluta]|nr:hypothetical protein O0L34_g5774 [Tuta absoluta]
MSFELEGPKPPDEMFFEKTHTGERQEEAAFQSDMSVHKDLFDTISEAHYLPELSGPHDELLDSLVEKGCEDNQILGQALDKLAHLVHAAPDYTEEEDDMLLGGAPVSDIIDRLEHELESPGRSSMTAAQGLLHLHHLTEHIPSDHIPSDHIPSDHIPSDHQQQPQEQSYVSEEVFAQQAPIQCAIDSLNSQPQPNDVTHVEYGDSAEKRLQDSGEAANLMYTETVPDTIEAYQKSFEQQSTSLPDQSDQQTPIQTLSTDANADAEMTEDESCEVKIEEPPDLNDLDDVASLKSADFEEIKQSPKTEDCSADEPTDLSVKLVEDSPPPPEIAAETTNALENNLLERSDEQPKDLSVHRRLPTPHASPRRTDVPRAPSRESDAMQSPQPSGIPAVPSSPEIFTMPLTKSKQTLFLETLLSSPSPKMYTSEVTITKQQCEPLNLGKHRKSASPTVSSCSDEIRKFNKDYGEPHEKRLKRVSTDDIVKITKVFSKNNEDTPEAKKKPEKSSHKSSDETSPLKQLQVLKSSPEFNIPDPLLVPKDKLNMILSNPGREIPALLIQRPELRLPEAFAFPAVLQDPDILVISLSQLENILENDAKKSQSPKPKEPKSAPAKIATTEQSRTSTSTPHAETTTSSSQPKPIPSMDALAGDIDAATSAALNQMLWLPYLSQLEAMAACSQNMDFLKALNNSGYNGPNYPDLSQMFNPSARFPMGPSGFPMMPPMDYDNRLQFAMWQEAMNHANASQRKQAQANAASTLEAQMKEIASKSSDVQNPYVHSTKNHQSKPHSSARTSPIAHNYNNSQRSMNHNPFLQGMYPGMNPNIRPNMPLPGLQIPYFNPNMMSASQRSPRTGQQKSPTSPYYPNNNYLQSVKQTESQNHHQRSNSTSSQESPRPRISVKSLHNLLEPGTAGVSGMRRNSNPSASLGRRREEPEVGSTTPGEPGPHLPPHPHDPSSFHLWHPLFGK